MLITCLSMNASWKLALDWKHAFYSVLVKLAVTQMQPWYMLLRNLWIPIKMNAIMAYILQENHETFIVSIPNPQIQSSAHWHQLSASKIWIIERNSRTLSQWYNMLFGTGSWSIKWYFDLGWSSILRGLLTWKSFSNDPI